MARRGTPEINAGSMADIAFLLLVFFLMVTTIESESGILRQLPPLPEEIEDSTKVKERDVFVVLVNMYDQLLVEGKSMEIGELKSSAKTFLVSNGVFKSGSIFKETNWDDTMPKREHVKKDSLQLELQNAKSRLSIAMSASNSTPQSIKDEEKSVKKYQKKLKAIELFGQTYMALPPSALISMQNNNNTTYNRYIQVQNELQAAIGELRDELSTAYFDMTYKEMNEKYEANRNDDAVAVPLKEKLYAIQQIFPSRISEAEPTDVQAY